MMYRVADAIEISVFICSICAIWAQLDYKQPSTSDMKMPHSVTECMNVKISKNIYIFFQNLRILFQRQSLDIFY